MSAASDRAYRMLRDRIFSGEFPAGARLRERQLCAELEVSRTPVREALRRLEAEGLVQIEPRRGGVVRGIDVDEAAEIFALGTVIESFAARTAAEKATPAALEELRGLLAEMTEVLGDGGEACRPRYMKLDNAFHRCIAEMCQSRRLVAALRQVVGVPALTRVIRRYSADQLRQSYEQHCSLVDAIAAGDADLAESVMRAHILAGRNIALAHLAEE